jgi:hypothetical protein
MRLRLSDATTSAVLGEHYRVQAEMCHQMARMTGSLSKRAGWSLLQSGRSWRGSKRKRQSLVSQKCPLACLFPKARWVASNQKNASANLLSPLSMRRSELPPLRRSSTGTESTRPEYGRLPENAWHAKPLHQVSVGCNSPGKRRMGLSFAAVVRFESPTVSADDQDRFRGLALSVAKNLRISSSVLRSWTPASSPSNAVSAT